ncbi:hypothetical protein V6N12_062967 [Hibiscus sabdariffa]|uniref:Uncharacterized protein n=1 Tax=Hibiscus sabdariffa TaxID=183260 RepID=A0ABR2FAN6_9ROSI
MAMGGHYCMLAAAHRPQPLFCLGQLAPVESEAASAQMGCWAAAHRPQPLFCLGQLAPVESEAASAQMGCW